MKRKGLLLLVLAALVAGGAFAQKVGDTVQITGSTSDYRVEEIRNDGRVMLVPIVTPEGVWLYGGNTLHTIKGTTGVWTASGEAWLKDLKKTGDLSWTATVVTKGRGSGAWNVCTIILSADGRTMKMSGDKNNWTFTRQ
jgi:uncharacterized protein (DUF2147 family)